MASLKTDLHSYKLLTNLGVILIFLGGAWLRFYQLENLMMFIGDQGRDFLVAREAIINRQLPLLGIPSSVPWINQGVLFIYLIIPTLVIGNFQPVSAALLMVILSLITLVIIYQLALSLWGRLAAIISLLIYSSSPLVIIHARMAWHTSPIPLVASLYFFSLVKLARGNSSYYYWSFLLFGMLMQLEISNLPIILLIPLVGWIFKIKTSLRESVISVLALAVAFLPTLIYDFTHQFSQIIGLGKWTAKTVLENFGYRGSTPINPSQLSLTTQIIFEYFQKYFSWGSQALSMGILIFAIPVFALSIKPLITHPKKFIPETILLLWTAITLISFYLHGMPSEAYFPILFPIFAWGLARLLSSAARTTYLKTVFTAIIIGLSVFNAAFFISQSALMTVSSLQGKNPFNTYGPPLSERRAAVNTIATVTNNRPISLTATGAGSEFTTFLDNYRYLLAIRDIAVVDSAQLQFNIEENSGKIIITNNQP